VNVSRLASAELVVHVFGPVEGPDAVQCYQQLRSLWDNLRLGLHLDAEVPNLGIGEELPSTLDAVGSGAVAACAGDHPDGFYQALFRKSHDVLILSAALAPRLVAANSWVDLQHQWDSVAQMPDAIYGDVRIFQGLIRTGQVTGSELRSLARWLAPLVPAARTEPAWQDRGCIADDGLAVWETGSIDDGRRERQLVVVGPPGQDAVLSAWTWSSGDAATTPLTRYLMHAAKLRYEYRVWEENRASVQTRRNQVSAETAAVLQRLRSADRGLPFDSDTVSKLLGPCYALDADVAALVDIASQIQQIRRTVQIAVANLSEYVEPSPTRGKLTLFGDDQKLGKWLATQLDDDATYLLAVKEGARDVVAAARGALERRSAALEQAEHEHRDKISLLQAVVISAAVLCLTAVQALNYHLPLKDGVRSAVVAALSACALWLVVAVTRLAVGPARTGRRERQKGWLVAESLVAGLALSTVCWATSSWIRLQLLHDQPSDAITWASSAAGFVIGAASVLVRRTRQRHQ
jgi:hypothetical protein